jgi:threonine dehydrogenase-like Zn-dependent dehydrogenase
MDVGIVLRRGEHAPRLARVETPPRKPSEALVRTLYTGVDGTDNEVLAGEHGAFPPGKDALVLGHECLGEVVEAPKDSGLAPGDHVVPLVRHGCGSCKECARNADFCPNEGYREHGIKELDGFFRATWTDDARTLVKAPRGLGKLAVLTEPLSIVVKAVEEARRIQQRVPWFVEEGGFHGQRALMAGTGSLGTVGAFLLVSEGMEVWALDRDPDDAAPPTLLRELGVRHINTKKQDVKDVARHVGGFDLVIEGTGAPSVAWACVQTLAGNGCMAMLGVPAEKPPTPLPASDIMREMVLKNQVLFGSVNSGRRHFEEAMRRLAEFRSRWPEATSRIISHTFAPQDVQAAYDTKGPSVIKKVIDWTRVG